MLLGELRQQLLYEAGRLDPRTKRHSISQSFIPALLYAKEAGLLGNHCTAISRGLRTAASSRYLPSKLRPERLLTAEDKFFCGEYTDLFIHDLYAFSKAQTKMLEVWSMPIGILNIKDESLGFTRGARF